MLLFTMTNKSNVQVSRSGKTMYHGLYYRFINRGSWSAEIAIEGAEVFLKFDTVWLWDIASTLDLHMKSLKRTRDMTGQEIV